MACLAHSGRTGNYDVGLCTGHICGVHRKDTLQVRLAEADIAKQTTLPPRLDILQLVVAALLCLFVLDLLDLIDFTCDLA